MNSFPSSQLMTAMVITVNVALQVTVLCVLALIVSRFILKRNPALKYALCLSALACILLSPAVVCLQLRTGYGIATITLPNSLSKQESDSVRTVQTPADNYAVAESAAPPRAIPWFDYSALAFIGLWSAGMTYGLWRLLRGWREARRIRSGIQPWTTPDSAGIYDNAERALGSPLPPIFVSPYVSMPLATGVFRPAVILPEDIGSTLAVEQLQQVLLHECAHIKFRHAVGGLLERFARLLFWPHPLVHMVCRELAVAREEVCDNVASQESGAACYARTLLAMAMAQGSLTAPQIASALALLGPETGLEERIIGLLDPRRNRMVQMNRWKLWAVTGTAFCALASTAAVRVVAAEKATAAKKGAAKVKTAGTKVQTKSGDLFVTRLDGRSADVVLVVPDGERLDRPDIELRSVGEDVFIISDDGETLGSIRLDGNSGSGPNGETLGSIRLDGNSGNTAVIKLNNLSAKKQDNLALKKAAEAKQKANVVKRAAVKPGATPAEMLAAKLKAEADLKLSLDKVVKSERLNGDSAKADEQVLRLIIPKVVTEKADRLK